MKKMFFSLLLACCSVLCPGLAREHEAACGPAASPESEVIFGNARFTVLTPRLVRMEWSADGKFEDRATLGIVNRRLDVPEFEVRKTSGSVTVKTDFLTLKYKGQENFNEKNLSVSFLMSEDGKEKGKWHPWMDDSGNLLGTARTLDRCDGDTLMDPYDPGIISRDGWAVIDESSRHLFEPVDSDWEYWVAERDSIVRQDLYFFGYGHDYTAALSDFTKIAGRIP
ncbi:MAG TPA: glycosyl hydrolase family 31, partial [Candidatus Cryptobacteroides intestinipullorum]|nr:glycosyl hydrolase family 31 [Candidatus Cryptobacteroides intestinipullorum]